MLLFDHKGRIWNITVPLPLTLAKGISLGFSVLSRKKKSCTLHFIPCDYGITFSTPSGYLKDCLLLLMAQSHHAAEIHQSATPMISSFLKQMKTLGCLSYLMSQHHLIILWLWAKHSSLSSLTLWLFFFFLTPCLVFPLYFPLCPWSFLPPVP